MGKLKNLTTMLVLTGATYLSESCSNIQTKDITQISTIDNYSQKDRTGQSKLSVIVEHNLNQFDLSWNLQKRSVELQTKYKKNFSDFSDKGDVEDPDSYYFRFNFWGMAPIDGRVTIRYKEIELEGYYPKALSYFEPKIKKEIKNELEYIAKTNRNLASK